MLANFHDLLYTQQVDVNFCSEINFLQAVKDLCRKAFLEKQESSLLEVHRILYRINIAHLAVPWEASPTSLLHPLIAKVRYTINEYWEQSERKKYAHFLTDLPSTTGFADWIRKFVDDHPKNCVHPIFPFLRDQATYQQMREFFFQETPLEMIFGDIVAMLLPGVYCDIKAEIATNFWDEVGHADMNDVHRELRAKLMDHLSIPRDCYLKQIDLFVREELELINTYLSAVLDRTKMTQAIGAMLATELMISNRFVYQIEGWKRNGIGVEHLKYLTEHVTVDAEHAEHWMERVVLPLVRRYPVVIPDLALGAARRLDVAGGVCDRLYRHLRNGRFATTPPGEAAIA